MSALSDFLRELGSGVKFDADHLPLHICSVRFCYYTSSDGPLVGITHEEQLKALCPKHFWEFLKLAVGI